MGSKPNKSNIKDREMIEIKDKNKENNNINFDFEEIKNKVVDLNSITLDEKFRNKTGYLVYFSFNEEVIDKLINIFNTEPIIRAEVVSIIGV